ncbi:MAG: acyl carrier protein [Planctomycetaceae bacterium]
MDNLLSRINDVFRTVFDDDELNVTRETTARDIEGWDSMMQVTLVVNFEKTFKVRLSAAEISSLKKVGDLEDLLRARLSGAGDKS